MRSTIRLGGGSGAVRPAKGDPCAGPVRRTFIETCEQCGKPSNGAYCPECIRAIQKGDLLVVADAGGTPHQGGRSRTDGSPPGVVRSQRPAATREGNDVTVPRSSNVPAVLCEKGFDRPCLFSGRKPQGVPDEVWMVGRSLHAAIREHLPTDSSVESGRNGVALALLAQKELFVVESEDNMDQDFLVTGGGTQGHMMFQRPFAVPGSQGISPGKTRETIIVDALQSVCVEGAEPMKVGLISRSTRSTSPGWRARVHAKEGEATVLIHPLK